MAAGVEGGEGGHYDSGGEGGHYGGEGGGAGGAAPASAEQVSEADIAKYDRDGDKKVSKEEFDLGPIQAADTAPPAAPA